MKKSSKLFLTFVVLSFVCAGSALAIEIPTLRIVVPETVVGGKTTPIFVETEDLGLKIPIGPAMVEWEAQGNTTPEFIISNKGEWEMKTQPVFEVTSVTLVAKVAWGEDGQEFEIKKRPNSFQELPRGQNGECSFEIIQEGRESIQERVVEAATETERLVAAAAFVPVRIYVAPYSTLKAYAGSTTNWLYVVAVDASGKSKIVSAYTVFTPSKSGVITFPYPLYNANHGNFRAGYTITTVTVTCKYLTLKTSTVVRVIRR